MRVPDEGVISGVLVLIGGVLLITPGVLTDITGMLLLIPTTRRYIAERIKRRVNVQFGNLSPAWSAGPGFGAGVPRSPGAAPHHRSAAGGAIDTSGTSLDP